MKTGIKALYILLLVKTDIKLTYGFFLAILKGYGYANRAN